MLSQSSLSGASISGAPQSADTTLPTMVGVISGSNITAASFTISWQAATDDTSVTGYEVSLDGAATYTDVGNVLTVTRTALSSATTYNVRVRAYDAAGNRSTPLSLAITTASTADVTLPVMVGSLAASQVTSSGFSIAWQAATDDVGVVGYEISTDNGNSYTNVGNVLTTSVTGLAASTLYNVKVRAYDAANNRALPIGTAVTTSAPPVTGGTLVQSVRAAMVTNPSSVILGSTAISVPYVKRASQNLMLYNKSGSAVVVNIVGTTATSVFIAGTGGGMLSLASGLNLTVQPGYMMLKLDAAHEFLQGAVTITANLADSVVACLIA
jgi:chitodextrinase